MSSALSSPSYTLATATSTYVVPKRANAILQQLHSMGTAAAAASPAAASKDAPPADKKQTLTIIDNRTGKSLDVPIQHNTIVATKFLDFGLKLYDPGFMNTCSATSRICEIQGGKGILRYRGYPIEQLAERSTFTEVSFLLIYGQLPDAAQLKYFNTRIMRHTFVHEDLKKLMSTFRYDAHPMGMIISTISALSTFHPEANPALTNQDVYKDLKLRNKQIHRLIGTLPTISAFAYRHRIGRPLVNPAGKNLSYTENFLYMLDRLSHVNYRPHARLARALDILFILHADHELNCVEGSSMVALSVGLQVPLAQLSALGTGVRVNALESAENTIKAGAVTEFLDRGMKECVEITLRDSRKLVCTPDHRIATTEGWKAAGSLTADDHVLIGPSAATLSLDSVKPWSLQLGTFRLSTESPGELMRTLAFLRLLGYMQSDGTLYQLQSGTVLCKLFLGHEHDGRAVVEDVFALTGDRPAVVLKTTAASSVYIVNIPAVLAKVFVGVPGVTIGKRSEMVTSWPTFLSADDVPACVVAEFLAGLWGGDGHSSRLFWDETIKRHRLHYATSLPITKTAALASNAALLTTQLVKLLAKAGVAGATVAEAYESQSSKKARKADSSLPAKLVHTVNVPTDSMLAFEERIGFRFCCHKAIRLGPAMAHLKARQAINAQHEKVVARVAALTNYKATMDAKDWLEALGARAFFLADDGTLVGDETLCYGCQQMAEGFNVPAEEHTCMSGDDAAAPSSSFSAVAASTSVSMSVDYEAGKFANDDSSASSSTEATPVSSRRSSVSTPYSRSLMSSNELEDDFLESPTPSINARERDGVIVISDDEMEVSPATRAAAAASSSASAPSSFSSAAASSAPAVSRSQEEGKSDNGEESPDPMEDAANNVGVDEAEDESGERRKTKPQYSVHRSMKALPVYHLQVLDVKKVGTKHVFDISVEHLESFTANGVAVHNCSTAAMRHLSSSGVDVYTAVAGAAGALYGPRHGGANEAVLRMLQKIGTVENIPAFIEKVKSKQVRLMGFGHRVYKNYDPRAKIIRKVAEEVFSILGKEPLIEVAVELERIALSDPFFVERKLYPNVDFYSGLIYKAMGFPTDYFPVLFMIPRTVGWLAHWYEFTDDPENRIVRPFQVYVGPGKRDYVNMSDRTANTTKANIISDVTAESKRRNAATSETEYAPAK